MADQVVKSERSPEQLKELEQLLETFRRKGDGRSYKQAEQLLERLGFSQNRTGRYHDLWKRGGFTVTLPRERTLKPFYVKLLIRVAERSLEIDA